MFLPFANVLGHPPVAMKCQNASGSNSNAQLFPLNYLRFARGYSASIGKEASDLVVLFIIITTRALHSVMDDVSAKTKSQLNYFDSTNAAANLHSL